ncbi:MAG: energy-coupling factor ABC transporter substrate-binding protein [Oscillochloris sp.]|nr:energy-coupling factor ABC transporter substrate-binding protein [Oscillochloris sp.]
MNPTPASHRWIFWLLLGIVVLLAVLPLLFIHNSEFGGADDAAEQTISEVAPDYQPWFRPLWEPPGGETESLFFALQAALGTGLIGYFFGLKRGQRRGSAGCNR